MATRLVICNGGVWKILSQKAVASDDVVLPDPDPTLNTAQRFGWYFGGYFADFVGEQECAAASMVAPGIVKGIHVVENTMWWSRREVRANHRFTDVHM